MNEFLKSEYYWCVCVFRKWKTFFVFCFRALENFSIYFFFCLCVREIELNSCITAMILDSRFFSCVFFFLVTEFKYLMFDNHFFLFLFFSMFNLDLCVCVVFFSGHKFLYNQKKRSKKTRIIFVVVVVLLWLINSIWSFISSIETQMNHWWKIKPSGNLFHVFEEEKAKSKRKYLFSVHHMWPVYFFFFLSFMDRAWFVDRIHTHAHTRIWK